MPRLGGETGWVNDEERAQDDQGYYYQQDREKELKQAPPWPVTERVSMFLITQSTSESVGIPALYAEDLPGDKLSDILGWIAVNRDDPQVVLSIFEGIRDGRLLLKVDDVIEPDPFTVFPDGSKVEVIPSSTQSRPSSGLEETAFQRLPEVQIRSGIGIVAAGLEGEEGLVYGLALLKKGRTLEGRPAPVAFLTRDERQTVLLRVAGVGKGEIFQADRYSSISAGLEAAAEYLRAQGAATIVPLGVFEKVSLAVRQVLEGLGIPLDPYVAADWQETLVGVVNVFRSA